MLAKVMLTLAASQSVCLCAEPRLELKTRRLILFDSYILSL
jgi:hypothetical protein